MSNKWLVSSLENKDGGVLEAEDIETMQFRMSDIFDGTEGEVYSVAEETGEIVCFGVYDKVDGQARIRWFFS